MKKRIIDTIFYVLLSLLTLAASYGLTLIHNGGNYYYSLELSILFLVFVFIMFISETLKKEEHENIKVIEVYKFFFKEIFLFLIILFVGTIISPFLINDIKTTNLAYFLLPMILTAFSVDFVADTYAYLRVSKSDKISTSLKTVLSLVPIPFIFISVISLLGEFTSISIWYLIVISIILKAIFKITMLLLINKSITKVNKVD